MPDVPAECLSRRYKALDDLIRELSMAAHCSSKFDPSVKLMCNFWEILKDDPNCNLAEEVQQCFLPNSEKGSCYSYTSYSPPENSCVFHPPKYQCYVSSSCQQPKGSCGSGASGPSGPPPSGTKDKAGPGTKEKSACSAPIAKVLTDLQNAASYDTSCGEKLQQLLEAQKVLQGQIVRLEAKEKEGVALMKEADRMWATMENAYKDKIAESLDRQNLLMKQLQEIEKSAAKWRKNKRDLESQLDSINKCQMEMVTKINQKSLDIKAIEGEIAAYKKRIEDTKKETESTKTAMNTKKKATDTRIAKIALEISTLEKKIREENKQKKYKELAGKAFIQEARTDLQNICKVLLQRRLEHEDLEAEKIALLQEINLLKETCNTCKDRCAKKQNDLAEEIKKTDIEIANYQLKCFKCNACVDSRDARTLCNDCPRCEERRQCLIDGETCAANIDEECVCSKVKQMFLSNIFENMSTVLEKKIKSNTAKSLGSEVLKCLKKSRNGKLSDRVKGLLQQFVLQTVKKNLNLTIVGGAVKTRCELDPAMYKQLMLCLKEVKATPTPKADKGCDVKKDPCGRWGGPGECNCPKGPKNCVCSRKAPPSVKDPATHPPEPPKDEPGEKDICPHKKEPCGPECAAHTLSRVGAEVAQFRPDPCSGQTCHFGKNMRAAQCVLGPEPLQNISKFTAETGLPEYITLGDEVTSLREKPPIPSSSSPRDERIIPRQLVIEEVMGKYMDVKPIERVSYVAAEKRPDVNERRISCNCVCSNRDNINIKSNVILISNEILQTSPDLDGELKIVWPKLKNNNVGKIFRNKHLKRNSEFYHGHHFQPKYKSAQFSKGSSRYVTPDDSVAASGPSGYLSAISSNDLRPDNDDRSSSNAKQLIAAKTVDFHKYSTDFEKPRNTKTKSFESTECSCRRRKLVELSPLTNGSKSNTSPFLLLPEVTQTVDDSCDPLVHYGIKRDTNVPRKYGFKVVKKSDTGSYEVAPSYEKEKENLSQDPNEECLVVKTSTSKGYAIVRQRFGDVREIQGKKAEILNEHKSKPNKGIAEFIEEVVYKNENVTDNLHIDGFKYDQMFCDMNNTKITIEVIGENGFITTVVATLIKTDSDNVVFDLGQLENKIDILGLDLERPVVLRRSMLGYYKLFVGEEKTKPNAVLKKTQSNDLVIVITESLIQSIIRDQRLKKDKVVMFKVKTKNSSNDEKLLPALVQLTPSHNYLVVMDKEFANNYTNTINKVLRDSDGVFVKLEETESTVTINFKEFVSKNAVLVNTQSEAIKILVNGPIFESMGGNLNKNTQRLKELEGLLKISRLPKNCLGEQTTYVVAKIKSSSDSNYYKNLKIRDSFLKGSITKFQRTDSGQFAAIIDKESKKRILDRLKNQMDNYNARFALSKRTSSGGLTIAFDSDEANAAQFDSFKITQSGNFLLIVDENIMKTIKTKDQSQLGSKHMIGKINNPKSKATETSNKAKFKKCTCSNECECKAKSTRNNKPLQKMVVSSGSFGKNSNPEASAARCSSQNSRHNTPNSCLKSEIINKLEEYSFTESSFSYGEKCLSDRIFEVTNLCNNVLNDYSFTNTIETSSGNSFLLESDPLSSQK